MRRVFLQRSLNLFQSCFNRIEKLKETKEKAVLHLLNRGDVLVNQPICLGTSLIFELQRFPLIFHAIWKPPSCADARPRLGVELVILAGHFWYRAQYVSLGLKCLTWFTLHFRSFCCVKSAATG